MTRTRFPAHHVVNMTLENDNGVAISVATCACGWTHHTRQANYAVQDAAVEAHWQKIEAAGLETAWHDQRGRPIGRAEAPKERRRIDTAAKPEKRK